MKGNISHLQAEIGALKGQRDTIINVEQPGELDFKDTKAKLAELEATLQLAKQDLAQ